MKTCFATLGQVMRIYWLQCITEIFWLTIFVVAPNISFPMDSQEFTVNEQTDITFTYTASGSPVPAISFMYEGQNLIRTDGRPMSLGGPLINRVMLGSEASSLNVTTSLYVVTRTLTLFNSVEGDTGNFMSSASANIPGTGVRSANISFSLLVYRELLKK